MVQRAMTRSFAVTDSLAVWSENWFYCSFRLRSENMRKYDTNRHKQQLDPMLPELPTVSQLSQVISQAAAPAFLLGALAAFVAVLIGCLYRIIDRTILLNAIADDDVVKSRLKADLPRLERRAAMTNRAILWAVISSITINCMVIVGFVSAFFQIQHERGVAVLFMISRGAFAVSLTDFAREVRIALGEFDHYA